MTFPAAAALCGLHALLSLLFLATSVAADDMTGGFPGIDSHFSGIDSGSGGGGVPTPDPNLKPWQTTPPAAPGRAVEYNNNTIFYERQAPTPIVVPFFSRFWWLAILILVLVVFVIYAALCVWICCHFEKSEQNKAKKVVETAYIENGFFDLDAYAHANGMHLVRTASAAHSSSGGGGRAMTPSSSSRNGSASGMRQRHVKRGSDSDSISGSGDDERSFGSGGSGGSGSGGVHFTDERGFIEEDLEEDDSFDDGDDYYAHDNVSTGSRASRHRY